MYIILCKDKTGHEWICERRLIDAESWDATVNDIAKGAWKDISSVIQTSTGFDVLPRMARKVQNIWADRGEKLEDRQKEFIKEHVGAKAAKKFAMESA